MGVLQSSAVMLDTSAAVSETVIKAAMKTCSSTRAEIDAEVKEKGDVLIKSLEAHSIMSRVAKDLGIETPNLSKFPKNQLTSLNGLIKVAEQQLKLQKRVKV